MHWNKIYKYKICNDGYGFQNSNFLTFQWLLVILYYSGKIPTRPIITKLNHDLISDIYYIGVTCKSTMYNQ